MGKLSISRDRFDSLYPDLVGHYDFFNCPVPAGISVAEFERRYVSNKLWRLNNLYTIINKDGEPVTFVMNPSQHKVYAATRAHPRVIILKSRQQGISTFWLVSFFDDAIACPFLSLGLMAQGTDEASTLLERTKLLWDSLGDEYKSFFNVRLNKDNSKEFSLSNKSTIFIRVSFRSTTLQRLHISELGKIANANPKRAKETKTGTLQALGRGNTGVIESTAEGKNMFKTMWDDAVLTEHSGQLTTKDFAPVFLSWLDDPDCLLDVPQVVDSEAQEYFDSLDVKLSEQQRNFWVAQRRELGGDIFQEYPATPEEAFTASRDGTYYARIFNESVVRRGQVCTGLYDPNLPTDVYFDLGVHDSFVVGIVQWYDKTWRIVDEYTNTGYALIHYLEWIKDLGIPIRALRMPHDIRVREQGTAHYNGKAKSRYDVVREWVKAESLGWRLDVLPRSGIEHGIEAVRRMLPSTYIDPSCSYMIDCLLNYSKEWDERLQTWKKTPVHDDYSHGADLVRMIASSTVESSGSHKSKLGRPGRYSSGVAL